VKQKAYLMAGYESDFYHQLAAYILRRILIPLAATPQRAALALGFMLKDDSDIFKEWDGDYESFIARFKEVLREHAVDIERMASRSQEDIRSVTSDHIYTLLKETDMGKRTLFFGIDSIMNQLHETGSVSEFSGFLEESYGAYYPGVKLNDSDRQLIKGNISFEHIQDFSMNTQGKGGIDLTNAGMNVQTQNNGGEIKFYMDAAMLQRLQNAPGFVPEIISIQPMTNLRSWLGLKDSDVKMASV
jgi:hypothetical protein